MHVPRSEASEIAAPATPLCGAHAAQPRGAEEVLGRRENGLEEDMKNIGLGQFLTSDVQPNWSGSARTSESKLPPHSRGTVFTHRPGRSHLEPAPDPPNARNSSPPEI